MNPKTVIHEERDQKSDHVEQYVDIKENINCIEHDIFLEEWRCFEVNSLFRESA